MVLTPSNIPSIPNSNSIVNHNTDNNNNRSTLSSSPSRAANPVHQVDIINSNSSNSASSNSSSINQNFAYNSGNNSTDTSSTSANNKPKSNSNIKRKSSVGNLFQNLMSSVRGSIANTNPSGSTSNSVTSRSSSVASAPSPPTNPSPYVTNSNVIMVNSGSPSPSSSSSNLSNTNSGINNNNHPTNISSFAPPQNAYIRNMTNRQRSTSTLTSNLNDSSTSTATMVGNTHNRFNAQAYNLSLTNSPTVANINQIYNNAENVDNSANVATAANNNNFTFNDLNQVQEEGGEENEISNSSNLFSNNSTNLFTNNTNTNANNNDNTDNNNNKRQKSSSDIFIEQGINAESGSSSNEGSSNMTEDLPGVVEESTGTPTDVAQPSELCDNNGFFSIRLTPAIDHSSSTSFVYFGPVIRKIKPDLVLDLGRYTEKSKLAATAPQGSSFPVVFKSKVVSRTHAEISVNETGQWFIKDKKSSSGTFLNHVRLSPPNVESQQFPISEGDLLQLGMDYRGGAEELYRCIKIKVELNGSWTRRATKFTKEAHERLKNLTLTTKNQEIHPCAICLLSIKPCQTVFVSSCSHSWHYKCIRPVIVKTYPQFLCPNCKAVCDMEAEIEDSDDEY